MIRLIVILSGIGLILYMVFWFKNQKRIYEIGQMTPEELVDAVIRREISVLEVPKTHRETVNTRLAEIQKELDKS